MAGSAARRRDHIPRSIGRGSRVGEEGRVFVDVGRRRRPWYDQGVWDAIRGVAENRSDSRARNTRRMRRWSGSSHRTRRRYNVVRMSKGRRHEMGFPGQPTEGRWRLVDTATTPPEQ